MNLTPGTRLGPYEIISPLGAGGMGEVYRARDTRLGRDVAVKSLPAEFAQDPERLARFEREARLLASLNHPNIAGIHGLEEVAGARYLVLEFVEGETLATRVSRGPLPMDDALHVCAQVATAVEAAHEAGIIHRDLKPGNVMIKPDGTVKVLDFGLAKGGAAGGAASDPALTTSPTVTHAATTAGMILGTAAYMSPEQARGKHVDRRTDIWSFGCVLFECLTGRPLFDGETVSDLIAKILQTTPDWGALPVNTPPRVRALLERCLARDTKQRLRDIGEARIVLEAPVDAHTPDTSIAASRRGVPVPVMVLIGVALVSIAAASAWLLKPSPVSAPLRTLDLVADDIDTDWFLTPMLSPDGSSIAYSSRDQIWVRDLDRLEPRAVADIDALTALFWSPDGTQVGFSSLKKLWRVSATGGQPVAVADIPGTGSIVGGAWGEDGTIVVAVWRGGLYRIAAASGATRSIVEPDPATQIDFHYPAFLPDGKIMFVTHWQQDRDEAGNERAPFDVFDGKGVRAIPSTPFRGDGWPLVTDGHLLFLRGEPNNGLFVLGFDPSNLRVSGEPVLIAPKVASFSAARDGSLLYMESTQGDARSELGWIDRTGTWIETLGAPRAGLKSPALSPDGRRVAYVAGGVEEREIWVRDFTRETETRLTFEPGLHDSPRWLDSSRILYGTRGTTSETNLKSVVSVRRADGSDAPRVVGGESGTGMAETYIETTRNPDQFLQIIDAAGHGGLRLLTIPPSGMATAQRVLRGEPEPNVLDMRLSGDGRLLAYVVDEKGYPEVFLTRFPSFDGKWQVSSDGGRQPQWDARTGTLYFIAGSGPADRSLVAIDVNADEPVPVGASVALFKLSKDDIRSAGFDAGFQVEPGGNRFLIVRPVRDSSGATARMVLVHNWRALLDEKRGR